MSPDDSAGNTEVMATPARFRGTVAGVVFGAISTSVGIGYFMASADKTWPMRLLEASSGIGFWATNFYEGIPAHVNAAATNMLLVAAGALQWGVVGLMFDLGRVLLNHLRK